jgi:hypothetical protein
MTMGSQLGTALGYDPADFYVWRASEGFAIHLSLKVVTELAAQIARAESESQTAETCGILLGRAIDTPHRTMVIEDFKLMPPSADPDAHPDTDDALLEIACRTVDAGSEAHALGFFRVGRDGSLNMGPRDLRTFSELFCQTGNIALLIQTHRRGGESDAALFYWQGGVQPSDFGFGFPFDPAQLANGHPGWRFPNPLDQTLPAQPPSPTPQEPTQTIPQAPAQTTPPPVYATGEDRIRWSRLLPTAALAVICIVVLQLALSSNRTAGSTPDPAAAATPEAATTPAPLPAAVEAPSATPLGLTVTARQHELEIRWNRESAAIAASASGVMKITENGTTEGVVIDRQQLHDGYVAYTPKTNDVSVRLEVTGKDGVTTAESVRSVTIP